MNTPAHDPAPDPAKARFFAIQAIRFSGVGLVVLGLLIVAGKLDLPEIAGYLLIAVGAIDAVLMPWFLARKWASCE